MFKFFLIIFIFWLSFSELKNNFPLVKTENISIAGSLSSRDDQKCVTGTNNTNNQSENEFMKIDPSDGILPFMDLVRSLLIQYPQIRQLEMQQKIINSLYDGLI